MCPEIVLCADAESMQNPAILGLETENIEAQSWLRVFCSAIEARQYLQADETTKEVWVASSDEIDAINLAAALKKDSMIRKVYLLASQGSGSLRSRANAAGIDGTLSQADFSRRYGGFKRMNTERREQVRLSGVDGQRRVYPPSAHEGSMRTRSIAEESPSTSIMTATGTAAHILSVVSASGGSGKSTISVLSALLAQNLGYRTLLIDADLQFGDMHHLLGERDPLRLDQIHDIAVIEKMASHENFPTLISAPMKLEQSELCEERVLSLVEKIQHRFDLIVVNTDSHWAGHHISLLEKSSTALFVLDQRASAIRSCKHALDLCVRCGVATHPFVFALNRCSRTAPLNSIDVSCSLQGRRVFELADGGRDIDELLGAALSKELIASNNPLCLSIEKLLLEVLPKKAIQNSLTQTQQKKRKKLWASPRRRKVACL